MSDKLKIGLVIAAVVFLGIPILGKLAQEQKATEKTAVATDAVKADAKGEPAVALKPPLLNAGNLTNTKWQMTIEGFPVTVTLLAGGRAIAESPMLEAVAKVKQIEGTWTVNGADLTVNASAMGKSVKETVKISGDQIIVKGKPVQRLQ